MVPEEIIHGMFLFLFASLLGHLFITIIDRLWFRIDYKKTERGLEALEHYHYGIALLAISFFFVTPVPLLSFALLGMGISFIYHESKQENFFAHKSTHFKESTLIGITLLIMAALVFSYLYLAN